MSSNNEENVSTEAAQSSIPLVSDSLFNEKIAHGITALKELPEWPSDREKEIPLYRDVSTTIYLEIIPTKMFTPDMRDPRKIFFLPHPLSFKRSVCVLQRDDVMEIQGAATTAALNELVVDEKIKIIPTSLLNEAFAQNDQDALKELAQLYDTHIGNRHHIRKAERKLDAVLHKEGKFFVRLYGEPYEKMSLQLALSKVVFCKNAAKNGYVTKIAHCGYTDAQVAENVRKALEIYEQGPRFGPLEEKSPTLVRLKIGSSEGAVIYASDGENEFQTKISQGIESQQLEKTISNKRPANGEASPISAPKTNKLNSTNAGELPISAPKTKKLNSTNAGKLPISAPKTKMSNSTNAVELANSAENGKKSNSTNAGELTNSAENGKESNSTNAGELTNSAPKTKKLNSTNAVKLPISPPKRKNLNSANAVELQISPPKKKKLNSTNAVELSILAPKKKKLNSSNAGKRPIAAVNGKKPNPINDAGRVMKAVYAASPAAAGTKEVPEESPKKPRRSKSDAMVLKMLNLSNDEANMFGT